MTAKKNKKKTTREERIAEQQEARERTRRAQQGSDKRDRLESEGRPRLYVGEPTETAKQLAGIIALSGTVFDNGHEPVRVVASEASMGMGMMPRAVALDAAFVRVLAHELTQPVKNDKNGNEVAAVVTTDIANIYLSLEGRWGLRPLKGITTCPVLSEGGGIRTAAGYDEATGLWCHNVPQVSVPERPTRENAEASLKLLRRTFRTFPFADATMKDENGVAVIVDDKPGMDESSFLAALMTGVVRSSLPLAPGFLGNAPPYSGAGTGKGLLVRLIAIISSGIPPSAFTGGHDDGEFDKRLTAALVEAQPCIFVDNLNNKTLCSDLLAASLTEDPMQVRVLGLTRNVRLHTKTFIALSGNGVQVAEDIARRLLISYLDARCDDPEQRKFEGSIQKEVHARREMLLAACLTIWRWGQQNEVTRGRSIGSYEVWARWCRDPLLALGCKDVVERISEIKAADPQRRAVVEVYEAWEVAHGHLLVHASDLADEVKRLIDPRAATDENGKVKASRQLIAGWLQRHARGTQIEGYRLEEVSDRKYRKPVAAYRLVNTVLQAANSNVQSASTSTEEDRLADFFRQK